jgi:hypothetical protein
MDGENSRRDFSGLWYWAWDRRGKLVKRRQNNEKMRKMRENV